MAVREGPVNAEGEQPCNLPTPLRTPRADMLLKSFTSKMLDVAQKQSIYERSKVKEMNIPIHCHNYHHVSYGKVRNSYQQTTAGQYNNVSAKYA